MKNNSLQDRCDITYSEDKKNKILLNTRIVLKTNNDELINSIYDSINDIIKSKKLFNIHITKGTYEDKSVIQIGTAQKSIAIEKVEQLIGVPQKSMIRIGDCGDIRGNDYSMLNCEQGYSVNKISGKNNCCFPIIDDNGRIMKGVDATLYLIGKAKILPAVCLERAIKDEYTYKYAKVEEGIIRGRNKYLNRFNNILNNNFNLVNGINDLFDEFSGSIKIPMYEWEIIKENSLKSFWAYGENEKLFYALRDDNNYLLRGSKTYYYFLANRENNDGKDLTTPENVIEWYNNYLLFLMKAYDAVKNTENLNFTINKKFVLGIIDNIRNLLLIIINHRLYSNYINENILFNLTSTQDTDYRKLYDISILAERLMANLCFLNNYCLSKEEVLDLISNSYVILMRELTKFKDNFELKDYSKEFRAYREIDNFSENYITLVLNQEKNPYIENFGVCGLSYGAIELPILYKVINKDIKDVLILKFNKLVSGYANKQLVDIRKFNMNNYGGLLGYDNVLTKNIILLDDNVLTGKTLQLALNSLYDYNFSVKNISIIRYPSVNRIDQMFMSNHGAANYDLFFDYITGLCFHSPYSWRDKNDLNPYEDSLGVFDLNRKKIVECLIKNHDFKEKSEVDKYNRRIIK